MYMIYIIRNIRWLHQLYMQYIPLLLSYIYQTNHSIYVCKNIISSLHIIIYISIYIHVATTYINEFVWIDRSYYIQTYHKHMVERRGGEKVMQLNRMIIYHTNVERNGIEEREVFYSKCVKTYLQLVNHMQHMQWLILLRIQKQFSSLLLFIFVFVVVLLFLLFYIMFINQIVSLLSLCSRIYVCICVFVLMFW